MLDTRLKVALASGGLDLPDVGQIAVFQPSADVDLSDVPQDRCDILQDFKPTFDVWSSRGFATSQVPQGPYAAAIVSLPRAKAEARAMIAQACAETRGIIVIDGQKTDGVDSILKEMKARVTINGPIAKAHGKLFWISEPATDLFSDWARGPALTDGGFWTAPGVFSADGVDLASALLVDALPDDLGKTVVDLGAGWGFLAAHVLTRAGVARLHLVEAGYMALECARRNVPDTRAEYHWHDATTWSAPEAVDTVVMNPPFHAGRAAEPQIGQKFVAAAARLLRPQGDLWMVANRHLPYEAELSAQFAHVAEVGGDARFKLFHASRPLRARRSGPGHQ